MNLIDLKKKRVKGHGNVLIYVFIIDIKRVLQIHIKLKGASDTVAAEQMTNVCSCSSRLNMELFLWVKGQLR